MTELVRAKSEQVATVTPSPPAVAFEHAVTENAGTPAQHIVPGTPAPSSVPEVSEDVMRAVAEQIESYLEANGRDLEFRVDSESGRTVITVRNRSTGEVIRQIPDAEALRIAQALGRQPNALIDISI